MYVQGKGVPQDYVRAYMWLNLAAALGYELALKVRDLVSDMVTPADIEQAQALATACIERSYKDC